MAARDGGRGLASPPPRSSRRARPREAARLSNSSLYKRDRGPPGPIGDAYDHLLGDLSVIQWGVAAFPAPLRKQNGYLRLGSMRLTEHLPGLFFTADGEAVDLRGPSPTYANIVLH